MPLNGREVRGSSARSRAARAMMRLGLGAIAIAGTITASACTEPVALKPVASVNIVPLFDSVEAGATISTFLVSLRDASGNDITGRTLTWSSSNSSIATVDANGTVHGVAVGQAQITAAAGGKSASAGVKVIIPIASITVQPESLGVATTLSRQINVQLVGPAGEAIGGRVISFASTSPAIATVSPGGSVTGIAPGTTTVTVSAGSKTKTVKVVVSPEPVTRVTIQPEDPVLLVRLGQSRQLNALCIGTSGSTLTGRTVNWFSSSPTTVSVGGGSGLVTGVALGVASVTADCEGFTDQVQIQVTPVPVITTSITPPQQTVLVGQQAQLAVTAKDSANNVLSTAGRAVIWTSDNLPVATVSAVGVVQGVGAGTAQINVSVDGIVSAPITVTVQNVPVASVTVTPNPGTIAMTPPGGTLTLTVTLRDASGNVLTNRPITWRSLDTSKATVTQAGVVSPVGAGAVSIEAEAEGIKGTALVSITP